MSARELNPDAALAVSVLSAEGACAVELELAAALAGLAMSGPCSGSVAGHGGGDACDRAVAIARCLQVWSGLTLRQSCWKATSQALVCLVAMQQLSTGGSILC